MALNPFFLQGAQSEQRLIQELINEQLKMYGVDVTYLPRKVVNRDSIFREIEASKFDDSYTLEAYVNTYEGYSGQGDIMTKFGVSLRCFFVASTIFENNDHLWKRLQGLLSTDRSRCADQFGGHFGGQSGSGTFCASRLRLF